jgi:hypothetical protein
MWNVPESELAMACRQAGPDLLRSHRVRFHSDPIIRRVVEALFAAQVSVRRLRLDM